MGWILHDFRTKFLLNIIAGLGSSAILGISCYIMVDQIVKEDLLLQEKNDDIHIHILEMNRNEQDFFSTEVINDNFFATGQSVYLSNFEKDYRRVLDDMDQIEEIEKKRNHHERMVLLDDTRQLVHDYHDQFNLAVEKIKERGFHDYGLEGQFSATVRGIESTLKQEFPEENLRAILLELRSNEKDFFLRNDLSYLDVHSANVEAFKQAVARSGTLDQSVKDQLYIDIDKYHKDFLKVVALDKEIGLTLDEGLVGKYRNTAQQIRPVVDNMESIHKTELSQMVDSSRSEMVILFSIIIASGVLTSIMITLSISALISKIKESDEREKKLRLELQNANEELVEKDKVKDEFINLAAHELRNPVLPIMLNAEALTDEVGNDDQHLRAIIRNAKKVTFLTNSLLDLSRLERGTFRLFKEKVDVVALVKEAIADSSSKVGSKKVELKLDSSLPDQTYFIEIDRIRIEEVVINLLDNAIKFTEEGQIVVRMQLTDKFLTISVVDNGDGIEESVRNRLFQKYASSTQKKGVGLGLSLSKAIVEAHGGTIWGENNASRKGATFTFTLPVPAS